MYAPVKPNGSRSTAQGMNMSAAPRHGHVTNAAVNIHRGPTAKELMAPCGSTDAAETNSPQVLEAAAVAN
eukprot:1877402-Pyramimonas_sp.AAC.1